MFPFNPTARDRQADLKSFLAGQFDDLLIDRGRWVVYGRQDLRQHCHCWSDVIGGSSITNDPSTFCCDCLATGHPVTLERMKVHVSLSVRRTYSKRSSLSPDASGDADSTSSLVYMRGGTYPQERDLVFETEWNVAGEDVPKYGVPTRLLRSWSLLIPNPLMTSDSGIVDLWLTGTQNHIIDRSALESFLRSAGPKILPPGTSEGLTPSQYRPYGPGQGNRYPTSENISPPQPWRPNNLNSI